MQRSSMVQLVQIAEDWHDLPQADARILDVLLDLAFLPSGCRVAELRLKDIMTRHGLETRVDIALLAVANTVTAVFMLS